MEINITKMMSADIDLSEFSASVAERGENAGQETWSNALNAEIRLVDTPDEIATCKQYFATFGAWDDEERASWTNQEVHALLVQLVAGDLREYLWAKAKGESEFKRWNEDCGGHIFQAENGEYYYYIGM